MHRTTVTAISAHHAVDQTCLDEQRALAIAAEGPINACYADVLKHRLKTMRRSKRADNMGAIREERQEPAHSVQLECDDLEEAYETERVNELYFSIMADVEECQRILNHEPEFHHKVSTISSTRTNNDSDSDEVTTKGEFEAEYGEPLWQVVDSLVMRQAENFKHDDVHQPYVHRGACSNEDEPWNEFWEYYRGECAKITAKDLALQRAMNNSSALQSKSGRPAFQRDCAIRMGEYSWVSKTREKISRDVALPRPECAPTLAQRILQEHEAFEEIERQRLEGKQDEPWHSQKAREKAIASARSVQSSSSESDDVEEMQAELLASRRLKGRKSIMKRGSAKQMSPGKLRRLAQEFQGDSDVQKVQLEFDTTRRPPPVFIFGGFEDYKKWLDPETQGRHDRGKKDIAETAAESPQWKWNMAVREYAASAQWQRRGARHDEEVSRKRVGNQAASMFEPQGVRLYTTPADKMRNVPPREALIPSPRTKRVITGPTYAQAKEIHLPTPSSNRFDPVLPRCDNAKISKAQKDPLSKEPKLDFHRPWSREGQVHRAQDNAEQEHGNEEDDITIRQLSSMERYAKVCKHTGVHPQTAIINYLAKLPPKLNMRGLGFGAEDVLALAASLPYRGCIEAVDMGENPRINDASACMLLRCLAKRHSVTMTSLKLDRCPRLGKEALRLCTRLLSQSFADMQLLDVSGQNIGTQEYGLLAFAIKRHRRLRDVRLADTGLGVFDKKQAQDVIASILGNEQLEALDLGWNNMDTASFLCLGKSVIEHPGLKSLGLSNTGAKIDPVLNGSTVLSFLEYLAFDKTLTYLDLSNNLMDESAMQVLEMAVWQHTEIQHINVSRNSLGVGGRRAVLRMLANTGSVALNEITAEDCRGGLTESVGKSPFVADPSGCYTRNMVQPAERALLRVLLRRFCQGPDALGPWKVFRTCSIRHESGIDSPFAPESFKLKNGVWEVPTSGVLSFEFCGGEILLKGHNEKSSPSTVVNDIVVRSRLKLKTRRKTIAILTLIKAEPDEQERETWLEALGRDFILTPEQLKALCHTEVQRSSCGKDPAGTCVQLMSCMIGPKDVREAMLCTHNLGELVRVQEKGRWLLSMNLFAPTGHYCLYLHNPADRAVAERLLLLNRWENMVWFANGHMDISQHANQKNIRNEVYNNRQFVWSAEEWGIFGSDHLSFDYVSLRRPSKNAKAIDDELWKMLLNTVQGTIEETLMGEFEDTEENDESYQEKNKFRNARRRKRDRLSNLGADYQNILKVFGTKRCGWERSVNQPLSDTNVVYALRAVSSRFYVTCRQMREMLNIFHRREVRVEVIIYLFLRMVDWPMNAKMLRPTLRDKDWCELRRKIGYINMFPFFQPENTWFQLDLSIYEERRCLCFLKQLADAEHHKNIKWPRIDWSGNAANPVWDTFVAGMPITWSTFENIVTKGLFETTYTCSMDAIALRLRRNLAAKQAGWVHLPEDRNLLMKKILWWSVLDDVPREVVMVLEFFCSRYRTLESAFNDIDVNRDRSLTYREFMAGMKRKMREIGFGTPKLLSTNDVKRDGPEEKKEGARRGAQKLISAMKVQKDPKEDDVFSLDDERLTEILHTTFKFLDPNNDAELSPREFGVLEGIWRELRLTTWEFVQHLIDCFGSLENAWAYADEDDNLVLTLEEFENLATRFRFYGPVRHVFMHLDSDDNGFISHVEWKLLESYEPLSWPEGV